MAKPRIPKSKQREIALERIDILFYQAEEKFALHPDLSNRYVELARKISMKLRLRIPSIYKRKYCKHCYAYLVPGKNCRVRIRTKKIIISCQECKKFMRIPLTKQKEKKD